MQLFVAIALNLQVKYTHKQHAILHTVGTVNQTRYCNCSVRFFLNASLVTEIVQDMLCVFVIVCTSFVQTVGSETVSRIFLYIK
jgi:hypothetical protein